MKKIFTLFAATVFAVGMFAGNFGILVNGKTYYQADPFGEQDFQGRDQYKTSVSLNQGDKWCIYDADNKAPFTIAMEAGEGSAKGNFTESTDAATCNVAGCYDFYIKLKWEDNSLWVQAGENCSSTGTDISGGQGGGDNPGGQGGGQGGGTSDDSYWYWKGYVDGVDLNNEIEGGLFDGGISEITVNDAGYIFVVYQVHGVPGVQYMASAYSDATHCTMTTSGGEKLKIPAGTYTLYLYDNGDGTVELSREQLAGKTLVDGGKSAVENTTISTKITKTIINGQVVIIKDGVRYNLLGAQLQ